MIIPKCECCEKEIKKGYKVTEKGMLSKTDHFCSKSCITAYYDIPWKLYFSLDDYIIERIN